ncbi:MAG: hypothetical protein ACYSU0_21660, partial [Planctomycetota bacterium]
MSAVPVDERTRPVGRELATVLEFVDRARRRVCALDLAAGAAASAAGGVALVTGALVPAGSYWCAVPAFAAAAGLLVVLAGVTVAARAAFGPPTVAEVADWVERASPELRDSLAASVEGGPLAGVSARYAAPRLARLRASAVEPRGRRGARAIVLAASAVALGAGVLARAVPPPPASPDERPRAAPAAKAPAPGGDAARVREPPARPDAASPTGTGASPGVGRTGGLEVIVRAGPAARPEKPSPGRAKAGEVLISSPAGF